MNLAPHINRNFNGIIWRMEIDALTGMLVIEVRNEIEKQVSFASINLASGEIYFDNLTTAERWLCGLEAVYNGVLLLHHYESAGSPTHKGIFAINASSGQEIWSDYNRTFNHLSQSGPVCFDSRIQPRKLYVTDIHTGNALRGYNPLIDLEAENEVNYPDMITSADYANPALPEIAYGNIIHKFDSNGYRVVSLHAQKNNALSQYLYVLKDRELVFNDILNTGIQKLQLEAFVVHRNYLIYLVNRVTLKVIKLETD